jgi:hypothetical protein
MTSSIPRKKKTTPSKRPNEVIDSSKKTNRQPPKRPFFDTIEPKPVPRDGALFILRADKEKVTEEEFVSQLMS